MTDAISLSRKATRFHQVIIGGLISTFVACNSKPASAPVTEKAIPASWSFTIGQDSHDEGTFAIDGLVFSAEGTLFCVGRLTGTLQNGKLSFPPTSTRGEGLVVLLEFALDGTLLRATPIGTAASMASSPIAIDAQANLLVAATSMKALTKDFRLFDIAKIEKRTGRILWSKRLEGMVINAVTANVSDAAGADFYIGGYFGGVLPMLSRPRAHGTQDVIMLRMNPDGVASWVKTFGGAPEASMPPTGYEGIGQSPRDADAIDDLKVLHDGTLAFAARFENDVQIGNALYKAGVPTTLVGVVDKRGKLIWSAKLGATSYGPSSIAPFGKGFLVLSSQVSWTKNDYSRLYWMDKEGSIVWQRDLVLEGSSRGTAGMQLASTREGIYVSGSFQSAHRVFGQNFEPHKSIEAEHSPYFQHGYLAELSAEGVALKVQARGSGTGYVPIALAVMGGYQAVGYCKQIEPRGECKARIEFQRTTMPSEGATL